MPVARDTNEQTTITSSTPTHAWYKIINNDTRRYIAKFQLYTGGASLHGRTWRLTNAG
jgi:hypothetical protein